MRLGRPELDFDRPETIEPALRGAAPRLIVNAAAYTAVDDAERDAPAAARANAVAPGRIAALAASLGIPLIHISTDYVFDGSKGAPYVETDAPSPAGVYGATKCAGEQAVLAAHGQAIILRTSWVYGIEGRNFVRTMLGAARRAPRLRVVADQRGCPTNAEDLAHAILAIVARLDAGWEDSYAGLFHAAGTGDTTWHGFAIAIFEEAARHGVARPVVEPITTADWPTPAKRPADSRLDCTKLAEIFDVRLPPWRDSLARDLPAILARL